MSITLKLKSGTVDESFPGQTWVPFDHNLLKIWRGQKKEDIIYLFADGHELDAIRAQFENIPITKGNSCIWHGDWAYFIVQNLSA